MGHSDNNITTVADMSKGSSIPTWAFGVAIEQMRDAVCIQDIAGRVEWMNPACEALFGWPLDILQGRKATEFVCLPGNRKLGDESRSFRYDLTSTIFGRNVIGEFQRRDGSRFCAQQSFSILKLGPSPDQTKIVITCRDVSKEMAIDRRLRRVHSNLEYSATHDPLTNLANRARLETFLRSKAAQDAFTAGHIGAMLIDISKFKHINDAMGHTAGDAVLCHVAKILKASCGFGDLACRLGADEFALVCLGCDGIEALMDKARGLIREISDPFDWQDRTLTINVAAGTSFAGVDCSNGEELIQAAAKALYNAKTGTGERLVYYTEEMGQSYRARVKQMRELRVALVEDQFEVYLQPQYDLQRESVSGCEALIRWNHPTEGVLAPGLFLPATDAAGLAADVDHVAMNKALDALVRLQAEGHKNLRISINVSSSILGDVNYPGLLDWAIQSRDLRHSDICIEVLETTIMDGGGIGIITAIERLKRLGVQVALDDFGTGYAGLAHMSAFDVDEIKLDRSMVMRISDDPRNRMIVRSILNLCADLEIEVVAEGVETEDQLSLLRSGNCPVIQGYGLAKPMSVDDTLQWLRNFAAVRTPLSFCSDSKDQVQPIAIGRR